MKTFNLAPEVWEIIRECPKIQLTPKQSIYLKEVYELPKEIRNELNQNNCIAVDRQNNIYLYSGDIKQFIEMLIFDIEKEIETKKKKK